MRVSDPSATRLAAVDAYIAKAKPFAQPILNHLREAVHRAAPGVEEQMKWSRPFFVYRGVILGNMSAFKEHCSFGLWGGGIAAKLREGGVASGEGMGSFGKLTSLAGLLDIAELDGYIRDAAELIGSGTRTKSIQRVAKPAREAEPLPEVLKAALNANPEVARRFAELSPSCRREYVEWIGGAKREETRAKRVVSALQMIAEGKNRDWKYEQRNTGPPRRNTGVSPLRGR